MPLSTIKDIKELANRHENDVRHARPGQTIQLGNGLFNDALSSGKALVQAYLDYELAEQRKPAV